MLFPSNDRSESNLFTMRFYPFEEREDFSLHILGARQDLRRHATRYGVVNPLNSE